MKQLRNQLLKPDIVAIIALVLLWMLFFWRVLTPNALDQVSIVEGEFTGQFLSFGAYQYSRLSQGEIPLWNPYNNGGLPFIADTQAVALYPPRLITIFAGKWFGGGWTYNALQLEIIVHVLVYSLLMYTFVRRITIDQTSSGPYAAFIAAVIAGYGGFITGYPLLQLAILEAAIWLPLAFLGILEATRHEAIHWRWLLLAAWALGLSWLAGHPQTSWFATYAAVGYLVWRSWKRIHWRTQLAALFLLGLVTIGVSAVQLLPAAEYLGHTMRSSLGFDAKGGGFPLQDLLQVLIPGSVSLFSPLYVGITGLVLAGLGIVRGQRDRLFFGALALIALLMSLGENSVLHHITYQLMPGANAFRGPERAAYLVVNALAVLAGLGVTAIMSRPEAAFVREIRRAVTALTLILAILAGGIFVAWLGNYAAYGDKVGPAVFSVLIAASLVLLLPIIMTGGQRNWRLILAVLIVFEIYSVTIDSEITFEPVPAQQRTYLQDPELVRRVKEEATAEPYRVDGGLVQGKIGIYGAGNSGSAYGLSDIRGISPLFLDGPHAIIQRELPSEVAWELFAVKYIFTDAEELPLPSQLIARDYPDGHTLNLHRLDDPRPFAHLTSAYVVAENDRGARELLRDPSFDERATVILQHEPALDMQETNSESLARVIMYKPESFTIQVETAANTILSVAQVDYPGWSVELDGQPVDTLRAYGALTAVVVPGGEHTVSYQYNPLSFRLGAIMSITTWGILLLLAISALTFRRIR